MRDGNHVIVLGMIPNKDFTAVHDVCRNLNNKIPTMAPTANPTFSSAAGWLPVAYTRRRGRCKGRVVVTNCPAWIYLSRPLSRYQNETIIRRQTSYLESASFVGASSQCARPYTRDTVTVSWKDIPPFKRACRASDPRAIEF